MLPPIFDVCAGDGVVRQLLLSTDGIVRFWEFGEADTTVKPYAVWQQIYGSPQNYMDKVPDMDVYGVQIDIYADDARQARAVAEAIRDALEPVSHIVSWDGESRDPVTRAYRISFSTNWFVPR